MNLDANTNVLIAAGVAVVTLLVLLVLSKSIRHWMGRVMQCAVDSRFPALAAKALSAAIDSTTR